MRIPQRLRPEDGAAAVEFALIVGVLAMLIFGMLQFGLTFFELQNLRASAREGGRLGAVGATPDAIRTDLESASNGAIRSGEASNTTTASIEHTPFIQRRRAKGSAIAHSVEGSRLARAHQVGIANDIGDQDGDRREIGGAGPRGYFPAR